jgi:hypothetical protein
MQILNFKVFTTRLRGAAQKQNPAHNTNFKF